MQISDFFNDLNKSDAGDYPEDSIVIELGQNVTKGKTEETTMYIYYFKRVPGL